MNQRIVPLISIAAGLIALILTFNYLNAKDREVQRVKDELYRNARTVSVVAARVNIPGGTALKAGDLDLIQITEATAPEQVIRKEDGKLILGKKTLFQIRAGRAILWSDLEGGDPGGRGLAPMVKPGCRALSIAVSGPAAVSGLVEPDDHVDVLGTFSFPTASGSDEMETVTLTVLQDVTVLATGQQLPRSYSSRRVAASSGYSTVTLEVTPREAEVLVFAQQMQGRLYLSLRNTSDGGVELDLPRVNFEALERKLPELNRDRQRNLRAKESR
jgi:pilus assembly protein CpaB